MNQPSLPPQGRYNDPHIQGLVVEELRRNNITAEKFYFSSDDWMVSYDGQVPAWNSVFGVAPYRKDGQSYYAECGVSQRFDAATGQWSEPAATIKEGLPLNEAEFDAAPGALPGATGGAVADGAVAGGAVADGAVAGASAGDAASGGVEHVSPSEESSSTVLASSMPGLGVPPQPEAPGQESAQPDAGEPDAGQPNADQADAGLAGFVAPAEAASQNDAPGGGDYGQSDDRAASSQTGPRHAVEADDDATADAETHVVDGEPANVDAAGDVDVADEKSSESVDPWAPAGGAAVAGSAVAGAAASGSSASEPVAAEPTDSDDATGADDAAEAADSTDSAALEAPEAMGPGGGSAVYGGDAINSREPVYQPPADSNQANVQGYSLSVKEDGTAELRVPLGGQVTLRWADQ